PIDDPESGYDPNDPWTGREPRVYKDILKDGDQIINESGPDRFAVLYNGGRHRSQINPPSVTGYYARRYSPMGSDLTISRTGSLQAYVPYPRLADIYLTYAEAVLFRPGGSPKASATNYPTTAEHAIKV